MPGTGWWKSSPRESNGHCAEGASWRKGTRCQTGECVEAAAAPGAVSVRDSKNPGGPVIPFGSAAWQRFTASLKTGSRQPLA